MISIAFFALFGLGCSHTVTTRQYYGVAYPDGKQEIFRFTLEGEADNMSKVRLRTGWMPTSALNALTTDFMNSPISPVLAETPPEKAGTRPVIIGPEGELPVPKDQRFVIVMSNDPQPWIDALDTIAKFADRFNVAHENLQKLKTSGAGADQLGLKLADLKKLRSEIAKIVGK